MAEVFDFGLQQHKIKMDGKFFENNLFAVAGDTGRRLEVQLLDSNNMVQNTTGISLRLNADVAGQATYAEATLVDATKGLYELDLPNGMLIAPGNWQFQWQIIGKSGEKLHSFAFTGSVGSNLSEGGSEATNFYLNVDDLKAMQEDLVNGTFNSEALETNVAEKLEALEETYAPRLTEVTAQLAEKAEKKFFRNSGTDMQPNIVNGSVYNKVDGNYIGNLIAGGGTDEKNANVIGGNPDAVGNTSMSNYATEEQKATNTNSNLSTILGGYDNVIQGIANNISGHHNAMKYPANHSSIAGGVYNFISWGMGQSIAGGQRNKIQSTTKARDNIVDSSTIAGGVNNVIDDSGQSVLSGGINNKINLGQANTLSGGSNNTIEGDTVNRIGNTISGGNNNKIINGTGNTIVGGYNNVSKGSYSTILGGDGNETTSDYVTALGSKAKAYSNNQVATGFNVNFSKKGDAQKSENMRIIEKNTASVTYVNVPIQDNSTVLFNIKVVAKRKDVIGDSAVFTIKGGASFSGETGKLIGTPVIDKFLSTGSSTWDVSLLMVGKLLTVGVKGEDGKSIQWVVHYELIENVVSVLS